MGGWLRYFTLKAQASTGLSSAIAISAMVALAAAVVAAVFFIVALYVWLADVYDSLIAALIVAGVFVLIAVIAVVVCLTVRRRNMERARLELAARSSSAPWLDPKLVAMGYQIGQAIGWRRLASLAAVAVLVGVVSKEWIGRAEESDADAADDTSSADD
jgi:type VI protein secretion system component VasK